MDQTTGLPPYKVAEVAKLLGVSTQVVGYAVREGRLPAFKIGKQWLIPRDQVARLVRGEKVTSAAP